VLQVLGSKSTNGANGLRAEKEWELAFREARQWETSDAPG
jgi:hypothetical protein